MLQDIEPYHFHIEYQNIPASEEDFLLLYRDGEVYLESEDGLVIPRCARLDSEARAGLIYLFSLDEQHYFMPPVKEELPEELLAGLYPRKIGSLRSFGPKALAFITVTGHQLHLWYRKNRICGSCGQPMVHDPKERAMRCPACGNVNYPMIAPSVIVGVKDGERLLVTRYAERHLPGNHYALVAGYIETGETPEDAVRREVMEEVGLRVKNIRYYKSQPWPFSSSLLLGFYCELDGSDRITLEEEELAEGRFLPREELPEVPDSPSLTGEMIEMFRTGKIR